MMSALALAEPAQAAPVSPNATLFPQLPLQAIKNMTAVTATPNESVFFIELLPLSVHPLTIRSTLEIGCGEATPLS